MQTSLARRSRRRRNGAAHRSGGGSVVSRIAVILPLLLLAVFVTSSLIVFITAVDVYAVYSKDLQDPKALLQAMTFNEQTVVLDRTATTTLARFGSENRTVLKYPDIPAVIVDATTSAEDRTFWTNAGFDPAAALSAIRDALAGRPRGASTITQQLVRQRLLPPTNGLADRKIKEIIQSMRLTQEFPGQAGKQAIITAYLNFNFYGNQSYGIAAAAQGYFGITDLNKIDIAQAAILAALLQSPSNYDLVVNAEVQVDGSLVVPSDQKVVVRRNWIIDQMIENEKAGTLKGKYSLADLQAAKSEPVKLSSQARVRMVAPQFDLQIRQQLALLVCGKGVDVSDCQLVDTGGYRVVTTLDAGMQKAAEKWLAAYVLAPNRGSKQATIDYLSGLGITSKTDKFDYSRIVGPSSTSSQGLRNANVHDGAVVAMDYRTGQVLAYAGSAGFYEKPVKNPSKTSQNLLDPQYDVLSSGAGRQPGSAFKPINYVVGLQDQKMTAASVFMDVATDFGNGYKPHDADNLERGPVRLREALQYSLNIPAVKAASINGVQHLMDRAKDFGLRFPANTYPGVSLGIGTLEVHPIDLVGAYGALADGGTLMPRTMILSVADSTGKTIWTAAGDQAAPTHPTTPAAAYVMTDILKGNTDPAQNNWWSQYKLMEGKTRRPATLKTGTSNETKDLFAVGYVAPPTDPKAPAIVAGVWAGNSDNSPGNAVMSLELAAPIWRSFMQDATAKTPVTDFVQPAGVVRADVDANSGLLPGPYTTKTWNEVFIAGTEPTRADDTKIPVEIDTVTNTLWTYDCPGVEATVGRLDLSHIDDANPNFQTYDNIWIARAKLGVGKKGGPNNGTTEYFYKRKFWTPFGETWGAPFAPDTYCTTNTGTPPPTASPTPSPSPTAVSIETPTPTLEPTPTESPTETPTQKPTPTPEVTATPTPTPEVTPTPVDTATPEATPAETTLLLPLPAVMLLWPLRRRRRRP